MWYASGFKSKVCKMEKREAYIDQRPFKRYNLKYSKDKDDITLTGNNISSIAYNQANFNEEPTLLSLKACVNACK